MAFQLSTDLFFQSPPILVLGWVKFVGFAFFFSLLMLWLLIQALVWLSERYSRNITCVKWWRSGVVAFLITIMMVIGWSIPLLFLEGEEEHVIKTMTSAIIAGVVMCWFLVGRLYQFELSHKLVVVIGIPLLILGSLAMGQVFHYKMFGS